MNDTEAAAEARRNAPQAHRDRVMAMAESAAVIFQEHGWTYHDEPAPPSAERIAEMIWHNIASVVRNGAGSSTLCGRFIVEMADDDHPLREAGDIIVSLRLGVLEPVET